MADHLIASDLSYEVYQLRRLNAERGLESFHANGLPVQGARVIVGIKAVELLARVGYERERDIPEGVSHEGHRG